MNEPSYDLGPQGSSQEAALDERCGDGGQDESKEKVVVVVVVVAGMLGLHTRMSEGATVQSGESWHLPSSTRLKVLVLLRGRHDSAVAATLDRII